VGNWKEGGLTLAKLGGCTSIYTGLFKSPDTVLNQDISQVTGTRDMAQVANERGRMGVLCGKYYFLILHH
jgi:hypothetical protein